MKTINEVQVVAGPFACLVCFQGKINSRSSSITDCARVFGRFRGQPVANLLRWLNSRFGEVTVHALDGSSSSLHIPESHIDHAAKGRS